jgi:hypothetical protein
MGEWRKSTYSGANGGSCVEVARAEGVAVRDTTDRDGVALEFSAAAWQEFTRRLRTNPRRPPSAGQHEMADGRGVTSPRSATDFTDLPDR